MRRRSRASSKLAKARSRKATARHSSSSVGQETEVARLRRERDEALLREAANSEILSLISRSPGELEPVFQSILENATRICEAKFGVLFLREGNGLRAVALHGAPLAYAEERQRHPVIYPLPTGLLGRTMATKRTRQTADKRTRRTTLSRQGAQARRWPSLAARAVW